MAAGKEMNIKYLDSNQKANMEKKDNSLEGMVSSLDIPFNVVD